PNAEFSRRAVPSQAKRRRGAPKRRPAACSSVHRHRPILADVSLLTQGQAKPIASSRTEQRRRRGRLERHVSWREACLVIWWCICLINVQRSPPGSLRTAEGNGRRRRSEGQLHKFAFSGN